MSDSLEVGAGLDEAQREALLSALLRQNPTGIVTAMDGDGRLVDLPPALELTGQRTNQIRNALEVIAPTSRREAVDSLRRAKVQGAARMRVELANGIEADCYLVDVRHRFGVLVGLVENASGIDLVTSIDHRPPVRPKSGRIDKDSVGMITALDERACAILGYAPGDLIGTRSLDLVHRDDQERAIEAWLELLGHPGGSTRVRARHRRGDGTWLWVELTNTNLLETGEGTVVGEMLDVSDEMAALEHLRQREELLTRLAEALPSGVLQLDRERNVVYTNERLHRLVGVGQAASFTEQLATVTAEDRAVLDAALDEVLSAGTDADVEVRLDIPGAGSQHCVSIAMRGLTGADGVSAGAVLSVDDITEASALRAELERRATTDDLTGCLTRTAIFATLDTRLHHHRLASSGATVVYLDLDDFKSINDTFGHDAGDQLLTHVAARIRATMREGDVIGRVGGDEFIVVASALASLDDAMHFGLRIGDAFTEPVEVVAGVPMHIRASIGVAWSSGPNVSAADLTAAADRAMYQSKRAGNGEPVVVPV